MTDLENKKSDLTPIATYHFTLDYNGNRKHIDKNEPLTFIPGPETTTYTYNSQKNRLLNDGTNNFTYDDEGQLSAENSTSYTFDYLESLAYYFYLLFLSLYDFK